MKANKYIALAATTLVVAGTAMSVQMPANASEIQPSLVLKMNSQRVSSTASESEPGNAVEQFVAAVEEKLSLEDYAGALELCEQAIAQDPKNATAFYYKAFCHFYLRQSLNVVAADLTAAIEINPQYIDALLTRGWVFQRMNDYDAALKDFKAVIAIQPTNLDAIHSCIDMHESMKNWTAVVEDYGMLIAVEPNNMEAYYFRALAQLELGDKTAAIADLEKLSELLLAQNMKSEYDYVQNLIAQIKDGSSSQTS